MTNASETGVQQPAPQPARAGATALPVRRRGRDQLDAREWSETARRLESSGVSTLLVPDTTGTPSPFIALAAAAAVTTELRVGTWVLAAPFRTPAAVVRETAALQWISAGRFELGIGAGLPFVEAAAEEQLLELRERTGLSYLTFPGQFLDGTREVIGRLSGR